jgi:UDP-N-acetylmuramoyl-tripeptide--D-alanyl-D-alanine ligase
MGDRAVLYGLSESAKVRAVDAVEAGLEGVRFTVIAGDERADVKLSLLGLHNVSNALAAIAVGLESGMSLAECAAAAGKLRAGDRRGEVLHWHGATIINDSYNSNPRALDAMVEALLSVPAKRHVVIAGEMLELGPDAAVLHTTCGVRMAERGVSLLLGVRGNAKAMVAGAASLGKMEAVFVESAEDAGAWMQANLREGDAVLVKASRGVKLERALVGLH